MTRPIKNVGDSDQDVAVANDLSVGEDVSVTGDASIGDDLSVEGDLIISGALTRVDIEEMVSAGNGFAGATAGWAMPSAHSGFTNSPIAGLPASQSGSTLIIPLENLKVGDTLTEFAVDAQVESAGGAVTLDAELFKLTNVAGDVTKASLGAIVQVAVTADTAVNASKVLAAPEVVAVGEQFYVLITGTTAALTDIQLLGIRTKKTSS